MKILVLDDRVIRHNHFKDKYPKDEITSVTTADECIKVLSEDYFDLVSLDHDLDGKEMVDSFTEPNTGYAVAKWLADNPDKWPKEIHLHSLNSKGRYYMKQLLPFAIERPCHVF